MFKHLSLEKCWSQAIIAQGLQALEFALNITSIITKQKAHNTISYHYSVHLSESILQVLKTKLQTPCSNSSQVSESSAATSFDVSLHLYLSHW